MTILYTHKIHMKIFKYTDTITYSSQHETIIVLLHFAVKKTWVSEHTHTHTEHWNLDQVLGLITPSFLIIT